MAATSSSRSACRENESEYRSATARSRRPRVEQNAAHVFGVIAPTVTHPAALRSADGWVTVGAITPKTWAAFCSTLGLRDLAVDERYSDSFSRHADREELVAAIEVHTTTRTTQELVESLEGAGVPCAPIADYAEVFTDEHLAARDYFWDAPHPVAGPVRQLGSPMRFSRTPSRRDTAGPVLGTHTRDALRAVGYSAAEVDALVESGAAAAVDR